MVGELPSYIRENPETRKSEIVNCPYEWIPIRTPPTRTTSLQINRENITLQIIELGTIPCFGEWCAIYPCERVRDFAEGRI